jgi:predicted phage tail protein
MKKIIGSGGKSGSGGGRVAKEEADSLQSIAYAQILDLVSEGEIEGLVSGKHSIFLDDTPLVDSDGIDNFTGVTIDFREGSQSQEFIEGFPSSENEVSVGVEVSSDTPVVRTISNSLLNAINVRISIPQLTYQDPSNGDLKGSELKFAIEVNSNGGGWVQKANDTIIGKCVSRYQKSYRIELPAVGPHDVRIRKITPDSGSSTLQNSLFWDSYGEVIDVKLRYPNSAIVGVRVDASNFKSIPKRAYELRLLKVKVPTNYDPLNKIYDGIWDGTFQVAWTNNPAWIYYDMLTSERYGCGINEDIVDKWTIYKIGQYCDEYVDDGFGGMEPRFTCNCYFQSRADAYNVLKDLANVCRAVAYWQNGQLTLSQDSPQDPSFLFTASNVINGEFQYQGTSRKDRYTVAVVTWNDPKDMYKQKVEYVEDADGIAKYGVIQSEIVALGCTSRGQAHRLGKWLLYTSQHETETVSFQTGIEASGLRPGQIIKIQDPMRAGQRFGGRVKTASTSSVTIDQDLTLDLVDNDYTLFVMMPDGSVAERMVESYSNRVISFDDELDEAPHEQGVWMLSSSELEPQTFRVISIAEENGQYNINALAHEPDKFDFIEDNLKLQDRNISLLSLTPENPNGLKITETLYETNGEVKVKVTFSWNNSPNAATYKAEYRKLNGNLISLGEVRANEIEIYNIDPGDYEFFVTAVSSFGIESSKSSISYLVIGKAYPPNSVTGLSLFPTGNMAYLSWDKSVDLDVLIGGSIRIRFSPNLDATWKDCVDVAILAGSTTRAQVPLMSGRYMAKFIDSSGNASNDASSIDTSIPEALKLNVVETLAESPDFEGEMTKMFFDEGYEGIALAAVLTIDEWLDPIDDVINFDYLGGVVDEGEYEFSDVVDLGEVFTCNLTALLEANAVDIGDSIDMRTEPVDSWVDLDGERIDTVNAELFVMTTEDDPNDIDAVWTDWKRFFVGAYKGRGFKFKLIATSTRANHNIIIRTLSVTLDMPDRTVHITQTLSSTMGTNVVFESPFKETPALGITAYNMGSGDYYVITSESASGFTITFYNSSNAPVTRTFDVLAKGFGRAA